MASRSEIWATSSVNMFGYVFLDVDPAKSLQNRITAVRGAKHLGEAMKKVVTSVKTRRVIGKLLDAVSKNTEPYLASYGIRIIERLLDSGKSVDEIVWTVVLAAAAATATQVQGVSPFSALLLCWINHNVGLADLFYSGRN